MFGTFKFHDVFVCEKEILDELKGPRIVLR